ncbi:hypothetical protein OG345_40235 (plasmid) [Streptomyces sp. NBC_01220]|nr:hypothetical protein OG345_40235 [Streptomyces sp. NBC_01220]
MCAGRPAHRTRSALRPGAATPITVMLGAMGTMGALAAPVIALALLSRRR